MGSTTVSARSKAPQSSLKAQFSAVQVLVNASGKNASSTLRRPRKPESVTSVPAVDGSVKSGAEAPTRGAVAEAVTVTTRAPWLRVGDAERIACPRGYDSTQCHRGRLGGQPAGVSV